MFCCNCSALMKKIERSEQEQKEGPFTFNYKCNDCGTLTGLSKQQKLYDGKVYDTEFYICKSIIIKLFDEVKNVKEQNDSKTNQGPSI